MSRVPARSPAPRREVVYPDSDGKPMADNTLQFEWIVTLKEGLEALFADRPDVFVAGDLLWYPIEGDNKTRTAPDAMVAFGRPKGHRGSYKQWEEGGVAPQVVFEVLSPGNRKAEMARKFRFYDRFGVEEYYVYDPDRNTLAGWIRQEGALRPIASMDGWTSPRIGVRFTRAEGTLHLTGPDGRTFETFVQNVRARRAAEQRADEEARRADEEAQRADEAARQAAEEARRADEAARQAAEEARRADEAARRATEEARRAERLAERLRALGIDPDTP